MRQRIEHERLLHICFSDYDRGLALVAESTNSSGGKEILGVGRIAVLRFYVEYWLADRG